MIKKAVTDYPIHELFENRWSPYRFTDRTVSAEDLLSLFEAARWAPSSYNEQPWRFILASKEQPEEFKRIFSCLLEGNQAWAKHASALVLACTHLTFENNGKSNKAAIHDLGAAVSYLSLEAASRGIAVHQMIGIEPEKAQQIYKIPAEHQVLTAFAIGYADLNGKTEDIYAERDETARKRKKISEVVFQKEWGNSMARI